MTFRIQPLPYAAFAPLFALDDTALAQRRARRVVAGPGSPCRVSLVDATLGEELLLANWTHQPADTPFHASHAVFVRRDAPQARPEPGEVPSALFTRMLSLRAFDDAGMIVAASLAPGDALADPLDALLHDPRTADVHIHYAAYGCYAARAVRA